MPAGNSINIVNSIDKSDTVCIYLPYGEVGSIEFRFVRENIPCAECLFVSVGNITDWNLVKGDFTTKKCDRKRKIKWNKCNG